MTAARRLVPLLALTALLAACAGVGRDQCLRSAVAEVRTIDRLIAERRAQGDAADSGDLLSMLLLSRARDLGQPGPGGLR